jgi:hypothetical protein
MLINPTIPAPIINKYIRGCSKPSIGIIPINTATTRGTIKPYINSIFKIIAIPDAIK